MSTTNLPHKTLYITKIWMDLSTNGPLLSIPNNRQVHYPDPQHKKQHLKKLEVDKNSELFIKLNALHKKILKNE